MTLSDWFSVWITFASSLGCLWVGSTVTEHHLKKDRILCTPEQVEKAMDKRIDYLKRVSRQYVVETNLDDVDWHVVAANLASDLIQITQKGR